MLTFICKALGALWLAIYALAYFGVVDLNVCIGVPGTCNAPAPAKAKVTT